MKYLNIIAVILFAFAVTLSSCSSETKTSARQENSEISEKQMEATTPEVAEPTIPIYESFDDLAYIFNQENDTTYVINFWATWCKPCVKELPYFDQLYNEYKSEKVKIILVSLDFPKQIQSKLIPFIKKNNVLPEVMVLTDGDANSWVDKVSSEWDGAIPVTLIYNRTERVFVPGDVSSYDELKSKVKPLII